MSPFERMVAEYRDHSISLMNEQYWGEVNDMCKGTDLEDTPWLCVKLHITPNSVHHYLYKVLKTHPVFDEIEGLLSVQFAHEIIGNKPIFKGCY